MPHSCTLTPAYKRDGNKELGGDLTEHNDQLPEHEHSLCSHPHHITDTNVK